MSEHPFVITPADYPEALGVVGTRVTLLASKGATRDYEITVQEGPEGAGPPPHHHAWDETFFVLYGSVEFTCAGETTLAEVGTLVHVPAGTAHAFRYGPGGGRFLEITGAGSAASQVFTAVAAVSSDPPDLGRIVEAMHRNGVEVAT
jgi:mannose-6-phosphate isomerase-like protein (cupin superfamily)